MIRNLIKYGTGLLALTSIALTGYAQNPVASAVDQSFKQYKLNTLQEKLFVHSDKDAYAAGELMWFKIYDVDGSVHNPLDISKVVYIEVLDNNNNAVLRAKIAMKNGDGSGSLYLPVTLNTGSYLLRAYTSWMKNFSPDYYFYKKLAIVNPLRSPEKQAKTTTPDYDVQFFPEGGNLVNGLQSVIAFKAADKNGKGVNIKGAVVRGTNDTVARFTAYKFGLGKFVIKPEKGSTYRAVINVNGKIITKDLPQALDNGYVMAVKDNGANQLSVTVNTTASGDVYLFTHTRNVINIAEASTVNNGTAQFTIDKSKLGEGISHLTIFNAEKQPVCERLYFKKPDNKLLITAGADQPQYNTRKKVAVNIDAKDMAGKAVTADMSIAVYRVDSLQTPAGMNIQNYLWLSSDLKGYIESPDYYFSNNDNEAADNLMLTQGWRRFNWTDVLSNKKPAFTYLPEYNGPVISAKLVNQSTNEPIGNAITYLSIPGKRVQLYAAMSDADGRLLFNMKDFYGAGEVVAQTNSKTDTNYRVDVLSPFSEKFSNIPLGSLALTAAMQSSVENESIAMQVQNTYNAAKMRRFYEPDVDSSAFYGKPYKSYLLDNYTRFTTMEEVMREYVTEVNISHNRDQFRILVLGQGNSILSKDNPLVLIDGVPLFNVTKLFSIDPLKIQKLEDVPFTYYWGASSNDGIFSFTSYKGDMGTQNLDPHAVVIDYDGLELQRQFYSPQYDTESAYKSRVPDFRNLLYWQPYVTGNAINFYTSDLTGNYIGIVQGITANGQPGVKYFTFKVVK